MSRPSTALMYQGPCKKKKEKKKEKKKKEKKKEKKKKEKKRVKKNMTRRANRRMSKKSLKWNRLGVPLLLECHALLHRVALIVPSFNGF
ncbi:unnamed protein product [Cuscuta campestris]|uniref:Uncharacterized protein n=1 Tax=Cuscuta campestris TaxID=132261 RepID=A0A484M9V6_9ASTE|nr:unnamed protein product [Cuscuta campestris]